jgi:two-component system LytT family sensor kinase
MEDSQQDLLRGAEGFQVENADALAAKEMKLLQKAIMAWRSRLSLFWLLQLTGWAAYGLMIYITFLPVLPSEASMLRLLQVKAVRSLFGFCLTLILHRIYKLCRANSLGFGQIALAVFLCSAVFGYVWVVCGNFYAWLLNPAGFRLNEVLTRAPREALDYSYILLTWSALYFGIKYWQDSQNERERGLKAEALAHQAQLEVLRYQLNPHFLFNALNSLRATIDEDPLRAKRMVTEFSEFLRYTLLSNDSTQARLRDEIEAIRNYLAIEKLRFEDRLQVEFNVDPEAEDFRMPGFLIHPLVENAIKYGMQSDSRPLVIQLTARRQGGALLVEVANTGRWVESNDRASHQANGMGLGLENLRQRLGQQFPGRSSFRIIEQDGWICAYLEIDAAPSVRD